MQIRGPQDLAPVGRGAVFRIHVQLYKALANEHRLGVMYALRDNEKCVSDLAAELGISIHNLSQHLAILRREHVVASRKEGQTVYYHLTNPKFIQASSLMREALAEQHHADDDALLAPDLMDAPRVFSLADEAGQASDSIGENEDAGGHWQIHLVSSAEVPTSPSPPGGGDGTTERSPRMEQGLMSRRKFLVGAGALAGAAGIVGLGIADRPSPARAAGTVTDLPWTYPTDSAKQPDPIKLAGLGYEVYYSQGCAEGAWWPLIDFLAAADPSSPWATLPKNIFSYGGGGVRSWGTLCGALNGAAAIIGLVAPGEDGKTITDEVFAWYGRTPIPTNQAERAVAAGTWTPAAGVPQLLPNVPTSIAHSQLCHASLSQWTMTTGNALGSTEHYDRCGKLTFDVEVKTITLLNDYFANGTLPTVTLDPTVATCDNCHGSNALGNQACDSCHDETPTHSSQ
jgi:DNA-binding transcriptional ArsR family regulator